MGKKTLILTEVRKRFFGETDVCLCATHDHDDHDDSGDRRLAIFSLLLLLVSLRSNLIVINRADRYKTGAKKSTPQFSKKKSDDDDDHHDC